ncbi:MAG: aminoacyl-tRNA hydrolase [Rickettsiaceae bacterium]|nr:MAG: aminoacyl-tRNA hydrolase [Rickettsiaceae bacterium]
MFLLVGLGNIGKQYLRSRHNAGFIIVDEIAKISNFSWSNSSKFCSQIIDETITSYRVIMIKPNTFMNLSGEAIRLISDYYKIEPQNIIVIHDDIDLMRQSIRFKFAGSAGGHNGLKSIDHYLGNNYYRIRIGVGRPENVNYNISDFVLAALDSQEYNHLLSVASSISSNFSLFLSGKHEEFKNQLGQTPV